MHGGPAMKNTITFRRAVEFTGWAKSLPAVHHTIAASEDHTIHTFSVHNPYTTRHHVVCVTLRHPGKALRSCGRRSGASIRTLEFVPGSRNPKETRGVWNAQYRLHTDSEDNYSWNKYRAESMGCLDSAAL